MSSVKVSEIVQRVRREIDQSPFIGEKISSDSDIYYNTDTQGLKDGVSFSPSTKFSDDDLLNRINRYTTFIVSKVKAQHTPKLIKKVSAPFSDLNNFQRLLFSRVFVGDKRAVYRRMDVVRRLHRSRNPVNEDYPVYTYEEGRMTLLPDKEGEAYIVTIPEKLVSLDDIMPLDVRLSRAIVLYVVGSVAQTLELKDVAEYYFNTAELEITGMSRDVMNSLIKETEVDSEKY